MRDEHFTTIIGAELSSAPWDERGAYWVTAAGLPLDFEAPQADDHALLRSLKAGHYYSTQGPSFRELLLDGERLRVETSEAYAITLTGGGDRWQRSQERTSERGEHIVRADFDLAPFHGSYCRATVVDPEGRRAWSNPIWP